MRDTRKTRRIWVRDDSCHRAVAVACRIVRGHISDGGTHRACRPQPRKHPAPIAAALAERRAG